MDIFSQAKNRVFLAPLAGITDKAFRQVCAEFGAGFTYTEMVSAKGLMYRNHRTAGLIAVSGAESRAGLQLFGSEPSVLADMAAFVCEEFSDRIALIDINMGCPAQKIIKNGEGCALMQTPALACGIIRAVKQASTLPVTVKFRKGWDEESINALSFAQMAEDAGADGVTVHGRTQKQLYSGKADWDIIRQIKEKLTIPVIGNGDIHCAEDAIKMRKETGCDAVMVARGALGNPFIFREIAALMQGGAQEPPALEERITTALRHLRLTVEDKGERRAVKEFRKHAAWYVKGMKNAAKFREDAVQAETYAHMEKLFHTLI
jgi:nifR3 family TIM-barrel protein